MANIATMSVNLVAKTIGFEKGMDKAKKRIRRFNKDMRASASQLQSFGKTMDGYGFAVGRYFGPAAVGAAVGGTALLTDRTLRNVDALGKQAQSLQIGVGELEKFRFAGSRAGVSAEKVDQAIRTMTQRMGEAQVGVGELIPFFQKMNFDLDRFMGLDISSQFKAIGKELDKLPAGQKKLAEFQKVFGEEAGAQMMRFFANGNLEQAAKDLAKLGRSLTEKDTKVAAEYVDTVGDLTEALSKLKQTAAIATAPAATRVAREATEIASAVSGITVDGKAKPIKKNGKVSGLRLYQAMLFGGQGAVDALPALRSAIKSTHLESRQGVSDFQSQRDAALFNRMHNDETQRDRAARTGNTPIVVKGMSN